MADSLLTVVNPGMVSIIVDAGRTHGQEQGLCEGGPMDAEAFEMANWLCCNPLNTPALEVMGRCEFEVSAKTSVAICGPEITVMVNQRQMPTWTTIHLSPGQQLSVEPHRLGQRAYIGLHGVWELPLIAGSVCTIAREKLGGIHGKGRALQSGDVLPARFSFLHETRTIPAEQRPDYQLATPLALVAGYQEKQFSSLSLARFYTSSYEVTSQISRMGYRLQGPTVKANSQTMRSEGINLGSVQVPGDGQPIIMMRDRQTLGGYPKLGSIAPYDIGRLAQAVPSDVVSFTRTDANDARSCWLLKQRFRSSLYKD